jgi:hypothetical protein
MPESELTLIFREVAREMAAEGRPLPVPPDQQDDELDAEFWARVATKRMGISPAG